MRTGWPRPDHAVRRGLEEQLRPRRVVDLVVERGRAVRLLHPGDAAARVRDAGRPDFLAVDRRQQRHLVERHALDERRSTSSWTVAAGSGDSRIRKAIRSVPPVSVKGTTLPSRSDRPIPCPTKNELLPTSWANPNIDYGGVNERATACTQAMRLIARSDRMHAVRSSWNASAATGPDELGHCELIGRANCRLRVARLQAAKLAQRRQHRQDIGRQRRGEFDRLTRRRMGNLQPQRVQRLPRQEHLGRLPDRGAISPRVIWRGRRTAGRTAPGSRCWPGGRESGACGPSCGRSAPPRSRRNARSLRKSLRPSRLAASSRRMAIFSRCCGWKPIGRSIMSRSRSGRADDDGEILLLDACAARTARPAAGGPVVLGHDDHAAGVAVEPMHDARPRRAAARCSTGRNETARPRSACPTNAPWPDARPCRAAC